MNARDYKLIRLVNAGYDKCRSANPDGRSDTGETFDLVDPQTVIEELPDEQSEAVELARSRRCKIGVLERVRTPNFFTPLTRRNTRGQVLTL